MRLYGTLDLVLPETSMTELTVDDIPMGVSLELGEQSFNAKIDGDTLVLTAEAEGEMWTMNGLALKTLARSGIDTIVLTSADASVAFPTAPALSGTVYAGLCAEGYVSSDYLYIVVPESVCVSVDGRYYTLEDNGELLPMEE